MNTTLIRKATVKEAIEVAQNIREEDRMEIEGLGHNLMALPLAVVLSDVAVAFTNTEGVLSGVAGIQSTDTPGHGLVWMICTPSLTQCPQTFVRQAKLWLEEQSHQYSLLSNLTDVRNTFHHKLLKLLGFKAVRTVQPPPHYLPYYEIVKLCA